MKQDFNLNNKKSGQEVSVEPVESPTLVGAMKQEAQPTPEAMGGCFTHLMVDIETMGASSYSSILSIGAIEFDIETGETGESFYVNVDLKSCLDLGLQVEASTIMWWLSQDKDAKKDLTETEPVPLKEALKEFSSFCNKDYQIWGNSARFDLGILGDAYKKVGLELPWDFRKERCVRTLVSFAPEIKNSFDFEGVRHNALDDCKFQVKYCAAIWNSFERVKSFYCQSAIEDREKCSKQCEHCEVYYAPLEKEPVYFMGIDPYGKDGGSPSLWFREKDGTIQEVKQL